MSSDTTKLSLEDQNTLDVNIRHVQGVLSLIFSSLSSDVPINSETVLEVIGDAENRMIAVKESVDVLTAA